MKPSVFLKKRHAKFLDEISGGTTVEYFKLIAAASSFTGELDADDAYADEGTTLPALVDFAPSEAIRQKFGVDIIFHAVIRIAEMHVCEGNITLQIGDAFRLPDEVDKYIIVKIIKDMQHATNFLEYIIALKHSKVSRG